MARNAIHSSVLLSAAIIAISAGTDQFITSQNICLFRQGNDLSTAISRKVYDECMAGKEYYLKDDCKVGATAATCYDYRP
jgi:hypothetical protein